tara:strand:+ start:3642 stop:4469 length:828 start_codon:yes stop_codon:yes gene_type:complete
MTTENLEEPTANPYNSRKEWHTPIESNHETADGMYFERPTKQATREAAPEEESTQKRTNYKKRYDDLKKHYDEKISTFKQREQELQAMARAQEPVYAPPKSAEELEQFRTEHPDLYETVESVAHMQSQQQVQGLQEKLSAIEEREARISRREAETALHDKHPDFEDIRGDNKFHEWASNQPEAIQDWIYNNPNNVGLAIKAIDLYKMETGISKTKKSKSPQSRQNAADFVSTKTTNVNTNEAKIWTQREIAAMSVQQFDKHEAEIDQAIVEGRVR